jgi:hypothetical protein
VLASADQSRWYAGSEIAFVIIMSDDLKQQQECVANAEFCEGLASRAASATAKRGSI